MRYYLALTNKIVFLRPRVERFTVPPRYAQGIVELPIRNSLSKTEKELKEHLKIRFVDEFLCLRCLALTGKFEMTKLNKNYALKYAAVCKFYVFANASPYILADSILLKFLKLAPPPPNKKVIIIGQSLFNIVLASKLTMLGCSVKVLDSKGRKI